MFKLYFSVNMGKFFHTLSSPFSSSLRQSSAENLSQDARHSNLSSLPHSLTSSSLYDLDITSLSSIPSHSSSNSTRSLNRFRSKFCVDQSFSSDEELVMTSSVAHMGCPPIQKAKLMSVPSLNPSESSLSSCTNTLIQSSDFSHGTNIINKISFILLKFL